LRFVPAGAGDCQAAARRRYRVDCGRSCGGPLDAITDVAGVRVGHATLNQGDSVLTGVTVILPHGGNLFREKVPGAVFVGNAFGKINGSLEALN
jgi:D-aminopeptidase